MCICVSYSIYYSRLVEILEIPHHVQYAYPVQGDPIYYIFLSFASHFSLQNFNRCDCACPQ